MRVSAAMLMMTRRLLMAGLATLALAACETPVTVQRFPDMTFAHYPALALNASRVDIVSNVQPTLQAVQVGSQFPEIGRASCRERLLKDL